MVPKTSDNDWLVRTRLQPPFAVVDSCWEKIAMDQEDFSDP